MATSVKSYVIPDSDDEDIAGEGEDESVRRFAKKRKAETNMQRWIKQLDVLLKEEQRKVRALSCQSRLQLRPGCFVVRRCDCGCVWVLSTNGESCARVRRVLLRNLPFWLPGGNACGRRISSGAVLAVHAREREKDTAAAAQDKCRCRQTRVLCVCSFEFGVWKSGGARQWCVWCLVFVRPAENMGILAGVHSF